MWMSKWIGLLGSMVLGMGAGGAGLAVPPPDASQITPAPIVYVELSVSRQDVTGDGRPDLITLLPCCPFPSR